MFFLWCWPDCSTTTLIHQYNKGSLVVNRLRGFMPKHQAHYPSDVIDSGFWRSLAEAAVSLLQEPHITGLQIATYMDTALKLPLYELNKCNAMCPYDTDAPGREMDDFETSNISPAKVTLSFKVRIWTLRAKRLPIDLYIHVESGQIQWSSWGVRTETRIYMISSLLTCYQPHRPWPSRYESECCKRHTFPLTFAFM